MSNYTNQEKSLRKIIKECSLEPNWCTSESWAILNSHDSPWLRLGRSHRSPPSSIIYSIAHFKSYNNMTMFFKTPIPILKLLSHESHHLGVHDFHCTFNLKVFKWKIIVLGKNFPKTYQEFLMELLWFFCWMIQGWRIILKVLFSTFQMVITCVMDHCFGKCVHI